MSNWLYYPGLAIFIFVSVFIICGLADHAIKYQDLVQQEEVSK